MVIRVNYFIFNLERVQGYRRAYKQQPITGKNRKCTDQSEAVLLRVVSMRSFTHRAAFGGIPPLFYDVHIWCGGGIYIDP